MSRLINADALEKDGWMMHRNVQVDKDTMSYQTKKPTDFPAIEPERKTGKWERWYETKEDETGTEYIPHCRCSECGTEYNPHSSKFVRFCNVCGAKMEEGESNG